MIIDKFLLPNYLIFYVVTVTLLQISHTDS